jgi:hypothetical protein
MRLERALSQILAPLCFTGPSGSRQEMRWIPDVKPKWKEGNQRGLQPVLIVLVSGLWSTRLPCWGYSRREGDLLALLEMTLRSLVARAVRRRGWFLRRKRE